jgi:hypothetical protein
VGKGEQPYQQIHGAERGGGRDGVTEDEYREDQEERVKRVGKRESRCEIEVAMGRSA